jgi:hypothetical protein
MSVEIDAYPANIQGWQALHRGQEASELINGLLGEGSQFHATQGFFVDGVDDTTAKLAPDWQDRAVRRDVEIDGRRVEAIAPDPNVLVAAKLAPGRSQGRAVRADLHEERPRAARRDPEAPRGHHARRDAERGPGTAAAGSACTWKGWTGNRTLITSADGSTPHRNAPLRQPVVVRADVDAVLPAKFREVSGIVGNAHSVHGRVAERELSPLCPQ